MKKAIIIGGGTVSHVRAHMALCAVAYGNTAKKLYQIANSESIKEKYPEIEPHLYLTRMASGGSSNLETNDDIYNLIKFQILPNLDIKIIIFNPAMVDFDGSILENGESTLSGKYEKRLKTKKGDQIMKLTPTYKIISMIRDKRPDIVLVGFKTTSDATESEQIEAGENLLKTNNCNFVLANDVVSRENILIHEGGYIRGTRNGLLDEIILRTYSLV